MFCAILLIQRDIKFVLRDSPGGEYLEPQKKKTEHGESKPMKNWII